MQIDIKKEEDIYRARTRVREFMEGKDLGNDSLMLTHVLTIVSELTRNICLHAKSGKVIAKIIEEGAKKGVELEFVDHGPGLDEEKIKQKRKKAIDAGMGLGLIASKNLSDKFYIESVPNEGTHISCIKWIK